VLVYERRLSGVISPPGRTSSAAKIDYEGWKVGVAMPNTPNPYSKPAHASCGSPHAALQRQGWASAVQGVSFWQWSPPCVGGEGNTLSWRDDQQGATCSLLGRRATVGQAGARFCLSLLRRVMQGAPCHAHRHRHMMHFFTHAVKALTTMAPKHPPRRPGVRAAIMRQPLDPEQSSIHGRSNLGEASAGPEAGLWRCQRAGAGLPGRMLARVLVYPGGGSQGVCLSDVELWIGVSSSCHLPPSGQAVSWTVAWR
jgi:hypothetical protein